MVIIKYTPIGYQITEQLVLQYIHGYYKLRSMFYLSKHIASVRTRQTSID